MRLGDGLSKPSLARKLPGTRRMACAYSQWFSGGPRTHTRTGQRKAHILHWTQTPSTGNEPPLASTKQSSLVECYTVGIPDVVLISDIQPLQVGPDLRMALLGAQHLVACRVVPLSHHITGGQT